MDTCYGELAQTIMAVEKSHHLLSTNWKPRRANGVVHSGSKGLRTRATNCSLRAGKMRCDVPTQRVRKKKGVSPPFLLFLFYSGPRWTEGCLEQPALLSPPIQMLASSRNTHRDNPEVVINLSTRWPVKLTLKLRIINH